MNLNPKGRNRRHSKQRVEDFNLEEHSPPVVTMVDQRTMAELLRAPTEGTIRMITSVGAAYRWLKKEPPHSITTWEDLISKFINEFFPPQEQQISVMKSRIFNNDQDSLNAVAGGNLLERSTQDVLTIIENKSKIRNSRSKPIVSQVKPCDVNSNSEIAKLTYAINQQTSVVTTAMTAMLKQFQATPPPAPVKVVEEICVTRGGAHPYYQCLAAGGNTFPKLRDNIQGYVSAAAVNYNQGLGSLPSNTIANPKGKLKAITTHSGLVIDGPIVPTPPQSINLEVDEHVEETFTDPDLAEYTIKVPPPLQEKDEVLIQNFWQMSKQLHINITLADAVILMPKYQKIHKALLSNKEKLQELAHTPLNENCLAVILKKLPKKLRDPGKFLIPCGFSELKCKALADLGASINLMPLSVWKKLGLPELIPTRMTLELANRAICTPAGIARDVFILVGKFTFPADFVIVDYESDLRMILHDGDERLTLNMRHDTSSYSNQPQKESINFINVFNNLSEDFIEDLFPNQLSGNLIFSPHPELTSSEVNNYIFDSEGCNALSEKFLDLDSTKDLHSPFHDNPLSGSTTYFSNSLLEEFTDELTLITCPPEYDDNLQFDIESDLKEIEFLLYRDKDSSLKDLIDQKNRANLADIFVDSIPEMFTDEHTPDYSSPSIFDVYDDDFLEVKSDAGNVYDDPFDSKEEKIKESKLLIDELDLPCDFLPPSEYDSFISQDFSRVDALPSTNNEDKIFNPDFQKPDEDFSFLLWKGHPHLGCSSFPLLSPLISSSMGELGQAQRPKTSASWEAPHAYP
nr:hypothetical protein [Tanacetum cinerariifolium]